MVNRMSVTAFVGNIANNLSVGKKLTSSFIIVLIIMMITVATGLIGFKKVEENADKEAVTVQMVNTLSTARLNRTLYQYTGSAENADKNLKALQQIIELAKTLDTFSWSQEGQAKIDSLQQQTETYMAQRSTFVSSIQRRNELAAVLRSAKIEDIAQQAASLSVSDSLPPESALVAVRLEARLQQSALLIEELIDSGSADTAARLSTALQQSAEYGKALAGQGGELASLNAALTTELASLQGNIDQFVTTFANQATQSKTLTGTATQLNESVENFFVWQQAQVKETMSHAMTIMLLAAAVGIAIALLIAWRITRNITRPLRETLHIAERISQGDLTMSISTQRRDEPGLLLQAVSVMNENLKEVISRVRSGVESVSRASAEIAAGNIDLSSRTEQQSAAVVETAASMEELTSTVKQNAENASHASKLAAEASSSADRGGKIVGEVVTTMEGIRASSHKIGDIINVINSIAFQTNILALNAAVEAARAGEQGRGFAVVAGEVRTLAQRSATAAKEIEALIHEAGSQVENGSKLVAGAGEAMEGIVTSVAQVRNIMNEIAGASEEQSRGISQIGQAMAEMDTTTQQNAALVEESSAAASSLEEQARELEQTISIFTLSGHKAQAAKKPAASKAAALKPALAETSWESF
ncbi:methyl-accepting chemotaxis protein [Kosakonia cowanii]